MRFRRLRGIAVALLVAVAGMALAAQPTATAPLDAEAARPPAAGDGLPAADGPVCRDAALPEADLLPPAPEARAACCTGPDKQACRDFCAAQRCAHGSTFCLDGQCACECQGCLPA
jgi:hypothetical protein